MMKKFIKWSLKNFLKIPEKVRFLIAGSFNTVAGYVSFVLFYFLLKNFLHYQIILFLSYLPTTIISFLTFKFLVFRTKGKWILQYPKVVLSSGLVYLTNMVVLYLLVEMLNVYILIAQAIAVSAMTVVSYLMNKNFSFHV